MWDQFTSIKEDDVLRGGLLVEIKLKQTSILLLVLIFRVMHELCSCSKTFSPCISCSQVAWRYCGSLHNILLTTPVGLLQHLCLCLLTELQNGWDWKGPLKIIMFNLLPKQGHTEHITQDCVPVVSEYLQERRSHWAARSITPSSSKELNFSSCRVRTSYLSFWACCFSSYHWAPLRRV